MTNTSNLPPPEPLDESERALARALRNLPAGSPPPELDAMILGAARRAAQIPEPRRDRRWIIGLSTAATAVLAMGVLLKMHGLGRDAVLEPPAEKETQTLSSAASNAAPAAPAPAAAAAMDDRKAGKPADGFVADGEPSSQAQQAQGRERQAEAEAQALKQAPRAFPEGIVSPPPARSPAPVITESPSMMSVPASPPAPAAAATSADERKEADTSSTARRDAGKLASPPSPEVMNRISATGGAAGPAAKDQAAKTAAPPEEAAKKTDLTGALQANEPASRSLDKVEVTGSRVHGADQNTAAGSAGATTSLSREKAALPPPSSDATLKPSDWIVRIRERLSRGDRAGAVSSIKAFVRAHPDVTIPDDLIPLLH
jgi:Meckel syndrome type 1 protein